MWVDYENNRVESSQELFGSLVHQEAYALISSLAPPGMEFQHTAALKSEYNSCNAITTDQRNTCLPEQMQSPAQETHVLEAVQRPAPLCRQFWKAGSYDKVSSQSSASLVPNTKTHMHVHPKFLHSNATSHKWVFGVSPCLKGCILSINSVSICFVISYCYGLFHAAVAELLDNAIDEIQNGATFVMVDKISDPKDGSPALLIQDDGSGMDPKAIRRCMSFGFSEKMSKNTIGQYGNGFKTSTMRLGADAIVFSRKVGSGILTQSVGLLSYTLLSHTRMGRIVVPMIDYEYTLSTAAWKPLYRDGTENFQSNISIILQWSPYSTEAELLKQFVDIGSHGTKVIIYNLWFADDGKLELDFDSDPEDIRLKGSNNARKNAKTLPTEEHIANQYHYSLRVYMSILYLQLPQNFSMILRGKVVEHHSIARDLKFPEFIVYRPHTKEGDILTTIGFLKEVHDVNIHGFNVCHKNRLILPFWEVAPYSKNRGRGVVGVLEANFAEPIHNKQDFERTSIFQRLETRLKNMAWEYWDNHCGLIGYHVNHSKKPAVSSLQTPYDLPRSARFEPVVLDNSTMSDSANDDDPGLGVLVGSVSQRKGQHQDSTGTKNPISSALTSTQISLTPEATNMENFTNVQLCTFGANEQRKQEAVLMIQEHKELRLKCLDFANREKELIQKVSLLKKELEEEKNRYGRMLSELPKLRTTL
ncbi:protein MICRORCHIDIA 6-like [Chenopodium quinoa]|uniref:protein MICRORCHIDIA 6-like n=1 Tax=Chenopodium quinoa TaxID=63459 RepID=UPI000B77E3F6|nr:protein MICRORCHIDIA 6-like [Chenopodium quinoa]